MVLVQMLDNQVGLEQETLVQQQARDGVVFGLEEGVG
jgi:hypothetical protein